jgi:hypothetical protein
MMRPLDPISTLEKAETPPLVSSPLRGEGAGRRMRGPRAPSVNGDKNSSSRYFYPAKSIQAHKSSLCIFPTTHPLPHTSPRPAFGYTGVRCRRGGIGASACVVDARDWQEAAPKGGSPPPLYGGSGVPWACFNRLCRPRTMPTVRKTAGKAVQAHKSSCPERVPSPPRRSCSKETFRLWQAMQRNRRARKNSRTGR